MTRKVMTREEEVARLAEVEAMNLPPGNNVKKWFREAMERKWALEDAGVEDLGEYRLNRMLDKCDRELGRG